MKLTGQNPGQLCNFAKGGMTLVEVVVALGLSGLTVAAIVSGYVFSTTLAEKSALSLAASARAMERIEETRSATWDTSSWPQVDQLVATNFPDKTVTLDLSGTGTGITYATNFTQISQISTDPLLKRIRVDCVWLFNGSLMVTNTIETCRSPNQ